MFSINVRVSEPLSAYDKHKVGPADVMMYVVDYFGVGYC